ncbi:MAG: hypothetical protein IBJ10_10050 [Phycisphaerales bacterium]|nr:hypothetical protein [Phycisphaerales bacterium]
MSAVCPSPLRMLEQLARWWSRRTLIDGGLRFCEPAESEPSNLYRCALPPRSSRLTPAASVLLAPGSPGSAPLDPTTPMALAVTSRAATLDAALDMLADLRAAVRPGQRPLADADCRNLIGLPGGGPGSDWDFGAPGSQTACVWRVIQIDVLAEPQPLLSAQAPDATAEGEAEALMTLVVRALPAVVVRAFDVHYAGADAAASVSVAGGALELRSTSAPLTSVPLADHTIDTLAAAVAAVAGWQASAVNPLVASAPAAALLPLAQRSALGAEHSIPLAAYTE